MLRRRRARDRLANAPLSARPVGGQGELVERIRAIVEALVDERRHLQAGTAAALELEANRLAIVYWQQELARLCEGARPTPADSTPNG